MICRGSAGFCVIMCRSLKDRGIGDSGFFDHPMALSFDGPIPSIA